MLVGWPAKADPVNTQKTEHNIINEKVQSLNSFFPGVTLFIEYILLPPAHHL